jgi:hypothetical protein
MTVSRIEGGTFMSIQHSSDGDPKTPFKSERSLETNGSPFYDYRQLEGRFAENYARQYYLEHREVPSDEYIVADHLIPFLRANHKGGSFLDPATGPTVHHQLLLASYFDHLHCADYLEDNRDALMAFVEDRPGALRWEHYAKFYLERLGKPATDEAIHALIASARSKIGTSIIPSNLMLSPVVNSGILYDAVGCFYCLEEVAKTEKDLVTIIDNVVRHIKPGGAFMASCLADSEFYLLQEEDGNSIRIPCLMMDEARLSRALESAGLIIPTGGITLKSTRGQADEGLPGILVAYARKPISS